MAKKAVSPERAALAAFLKKHEGKELTDAQKAEHTRLVDTVRAEEFRKLAKVRANRALRAIEGLSKLASPGRYHYTPEQVKKLEEAFRVALGNCFGAFHGKVTASAGIDL